MRVEAVRGTFPPFVNIVISATRDEVSWNDALRWHNEVQVVKGNTLCDLLEEAARRLDDSDSGIDWHRAIILRGMCEAIKKEQREEELARKTKEARK